MLGAFIEYCALLEKIFQQKNINYQKHCASRFAIFLSELEISEPVKIGQKQIQKLFKLKIQLDTLLRKNSLREDGNVLFAQAENNLYRLTCESILKNPINSLKEISWVANLDQRLFDGLICQIDSNSLIIDINDLLFVLGDSQLRKKINDEIFFKIVTSIEYLKMTVKDYHGSQYFKQYLDESKKLPVYVEA